MYMADEGGCGKPDPAGEFACAISLWEEAHLKADAEALNLSKAYDGIDQLMRETMRIGVQFEAWACEHIAFEKLSGVWAYILLESFGSACLNVLPAESLSNFGDEECLRVALQLRLPVLLAEGIPVPIQVSSSNPVQSSPFRILRIVTLRDDLTDEEPAIFTAQDDPFDGRYGRPYFALYGINSAGDPGEHISNRRTYPETVQLAQKLAPGIEFPTIPTAATETGSP